MKKFLLIGLIVMSAGLAQAECDLDDQSPTKTYIELALDAEPSIDFFSHADFNGSPQMRLDRFGLFINEDPVCEWPNGNFFASAEPNRVLESCPQDVPVKSGLGNRGLGTAVLCLEVTSLRNQSVEVRYKEESLYFSLQNLPKDKWKLITPLR